MLDDGDDNGSAGGDDNAMLDDGVAADAAPLAAIDDDAAAVVDAATAALASYDDVAAADDDDAAAPPPPPMTRGCALALVALSSFGFALQSLVVKRATQQNRAAPPMQMVFFRGWIQALGCCAVLACHPPMRRRPTRWLGDSWKECRWLCARGFVGFEPASC